MQNVFFFIGLFPQIAFLFPCSPIDGAAVGLECCSVVTESKSSSRDNCFKVFLIHPAAGEQGQQEVPEARAAVGEHQEGAQEEEEGQDRRELQLLGLAPHPRPAELRREAVQAA